MRNKEIVGIIGGAGVAATNKLNELIELEFTKRGAYRDSHHPEIITYQATAVPSRSMFLEGKGDNFVEGYVAIGEKLKAAGATVLFMACNTAHFSFEEINDSLDVPVINMVEQVVLAAKATGIIEIGVMASDGCLKAKVYDKYFEKIFPDAKLIYPDKIMQALTTKGICNVKNTNRFLPINNAERPQHIFNEVLNCLKKRGAKLVIFGCTDIAVDFDLTSYQGLPIVDSLQVLVKIICNNVLQSNIPGNTRLDDFYSKLSKTIEKQEDSRLKSNETGQLDADFVRKFKVGRKKILDLGSGTGLLVNKIKNDFESIVCIEKYTEFSKFIDIDIDIGNGNGSGNDKSITIINEDLLGWSVQDSGFDMALSFGVMHYFSRIEAMLIYRKAFASLKNNGIFIVKNQFGIIDDVVVDGYSEELKSYYYAEYRQVDSEISLLGNIGFLNVEKIDVYPSEYNRWDNTHFYALVCRKANYLL